MKKYLPQDKSLKPNVATSEIYGFKKKLFLISIPYLIVALLGIGCLLLMAFSSGGITDKIILGLIGAGLFCLSFGVWFHDFYTLRKSLKQRLTLPGKEITIQITFFDPYTIDCLFFNPQTGTKERAPLIHFGGRKKLKAATDYLAYLNSESEIILLK